MDHDTLEKCIHAVDTGLTHLSAALREMPPTAEARQALVMGPLVAYLIAHAQLVTVVCQLGSFNTAFEDKSGDQS